jgi:hypothetical protein
MSKKDNAKKSAPAANETAQGNAPAATESTASPEQDAPLGDQTPPPAGDTGTPEGLEREQDDLMLLGSDVLPAEVEIAPGKTVQLGDVVNRAFIDSGLPSRKAWNALPMQDIEARLAATVVAMREEAAPDPDADLEDDSTDETPPEVDEDAQAARARRADLEMFADLFGISHFDVSNRALDRQVRKASDDFFRTADSLDLRYSGDGSFESRQAFIAEVEAASKSQPRSYIVQWDLQRNGKRYVDGDKITLTRLEAIEIGSDCIKLEE